MTESTKDNLVAAAQQFLRVKFPEEHESRLQEMWDAIAQDMNGAAMREPFSPSARLLGMLGGPGDSVLSRICILMAILHESIVEILRNSDRPLVNIVETICARHEEQVLAKDIVRLFATVLNRKSPSQASEPVNQGGDKVREIVLCHPNRFKVVRVYKQMDVRERVIELTPAEFAIFATLALRLYCDSKATRTIPNPNQPGMVRDDELGKIYEQFRRTPSMASALNADDPTESARAMYYSKLKKSLTREGLQSLLPPRFKELFLRLPADRIKLDEDFLRYERKLIGEFRRVFGEEYRSLPAEIAEEPKF